MNLTTEPERISWPQMHYLFIERRGPFMETAPEAWGLVHGDVPQIAETNEITGYMAMYRPEERVYRAGVSLSAAPATLPDGFGYEHFPGGDYLKFVLTGPFVHLPEATGRAFEIVEEKGLRLRDAFCIEHYVTDPRVTPEDQLTTEILLPAS